MTLERKGIPGIHYPLPPGCKVVQMDGKTDPRKLVKWCQILQNFVTPSQEKVINRVISNIEEESEETNLETDEKITPIGDPPTSKRYEFVKNSHVGSVKPQS